MKIKIKVNLLFCHGKWSMIFQPISKGGLINTVDLRVPNEITDIEIIQPKYISCYTTYMWHVTFALVFPHLDFFFTVLWSIYNKVVLQREREGDTSILFFIESALLVSIKLGILIITTTELRDFLYSFLRSSNLRRRKVYTDFKWVPSKNYWRHFGRYNWRNFLLF